MVYRSWSLPTPMQGHRFASRYRLSPMCNDEMQLQGTYILHLTTQVEQAAFFFFFFLGRLREKDHSQDQKHIIRVICSHSVREEHLELVLEPNSD